MKFAEIKMVKFVELMNVEIGDMFVSNEAMEQIENILELEEKSAEELTAIRNTVVRTIAEEFVKPMDEAKNYKEAIRYETKMSGITAVIDNRLWNMGAMM